MKTHLYCILLLILSCQAHAKSPSFTYVEAELISSGDIDVTDGSLSADIDLDGFALAGSVELGLVFLQASRFELESDDLLVGSNIDDSISTLAVGLAFDLPRTKIFGLIRARRDELSLSGGIFDEDADVNFVQLEAGVRFNVTDRFEINGNIGFVPATESGESFGIGAQFFITDHFGITLDFNTLSAEEDDIELDFDTSSIGLRYTF